MSNYKIRVANKGDIKEAQELFFELGYKWACGEKQNPAINECPTVIRGHDYGCMTWSISSEPLYKDHKEITLPELRDLVVLKRNNREDANVSEENCLYDLYLTESKELYFYHCGKNKWILSNLNGDDDYYESLKPIEKTMKEYLRKNSDGTYSYIGTVQPDHVSDFMIEIPEGSETFNYYDRKDNLFFLKGSGEDTMFSNDLNDWDWKHWGNIDFDGVVCLWSRYTHPEELPFIDDESYNPDYDGSEKEELESLNDQYAEIEKVRQSAWQKQEGGSHYKNLKIQPMQYALENKLDYAQSNVVKYVTRHKEKNGKEDLLKAIHNIELMIEFYYGDEK